MERRSHGPDPTVPSQGSLDDQHQPHPRPFITTLGWDINAIIASSPNFHPMQRVHYTAPNARVEIVIPRVERDGNPLIIAGWNRHPRWPKSLFNVDWLKKNGDQNPTVRNVHDWTDLKVPLDDFIKKLRESPAYASANEQERLYGKDGECPAAWTDWLQSDAIPDDLLFHGSNDFLKFLPEKTKVQTLMCYMGIGDTFTPFHKDLCASTGQNLMCFSEHSGSAFWFMTKSSAAPRVAAYFHQLGQEIDLETHVVTIEELAKAPFDVYIAEQQVGDLVLVPPRSCHQVVNKGGITIKTSWSRMSLSGLQTALWHELPIYHRVCRQEIYKVKSNIYHALQQLTSVVEDLSEPKRAASTETLKQLATLFDEILAGEFSISRDSMPHVSHSETSHTDNLHCDFCGADIFQSFFECDSCLPASSSVSAGILPVGDGLVLCPLCFVEGRTCQCGEMQPVQCRPFSELLAIRDRAVKAIQRGDDDYTNAYGYLSEQPLQLLSGRDANIFEAACKLFQKQRVDNKAVRSCRARLSHPVPASAAIYCKSCHFSKCHKHLLELDSVHAVDAIILSDRHDGDANWHQSHRNGSQQYAAARQRVIEDEELGSRPNMSHRFIYLAKTFTTCRAIAPEVIRHGWYDRFVQPTSIPIANSPAKMLVGTSDEVDGNEQDGPHCVEDSPSSTSLNPIVKDRDFQTTSSRRTPPSPFVGSSNGGINEILPPRQPSPPVIPDSPSPIVNPMSPSPESGADQELVILARASIQHDVSNDGFLSAPYLPASSKLPPTVAPLVSAVADDADNLSDLTDLPTEAGSPPRSFIATNSTLEASNQRFSMEPSLSPSSPLAAKRLLNGSKSRPRLVFDCVEIPQPEWYNRRREEVSSPQRKRKRVAGLLSADMVGSADSDDIPLITQEISSQSLPKRKRKMSQGPASRPPPSSRQTDASLNVGNPPPPNNFLANALNQTFQSNSNNAAPHVSTTHLPLDATPSVSNAVISPSVKPQYKDFGVQKNLNFTRNTITTEPSKELSSCITRLEVENRDLRTKVETYRREYEALRDNLDEINRLYNSPRHRHRHHYHRHSPPPLPPPSSPPPPFSPPPPPPFSPPPLPPLPPQPPSGPSNCVPSPELSTHPRWRTRNVTSEGRSHYMDVQEPDYPPIETLRPLTPPSPKGISASRWRTPTTKFRGGDQGSQSRPCYGPQQHGRRRSSTETANGRSQRGKLRGPSFGRSAELIANAAPLNSSADVEARVSPSPPRIDGAVVRSHDKVHDKDE